VLLSLFCWTVAAEKLWPAPVKPAPGRDEQPAKVLRLGVNNWLFWRSHENGRFAGVDVDVWREIARRNDLALECVAVANLDDLAGSMAKNHLDAFVSLLRTPEREAFLDFLEPPCLTKLAYETYVRADSPRRVDGLEDLRGSKMFVVGSSFAALDRAVGIQKSAALWDAAPAFEQLDRGAVDAVLITQWLAIWYFRQSGNESMFRRATYVHREYHPSYLVMSRSSPLLGRYKVHFEQTIQELIEDGTVRRIVDGYVPGWYERYPAPSRER
jgi:ABC-type amino acid transport substrate-binding protein